MSPPVLGLRANWRQFALLVLINAFVGAMVGIERATLSPLAQESFGIGSRTAALSFIASFGAAKAVANLFAARLADRVGRRPVLLLGWLIGLAAPVMVIVAPTWGWVVVANLILGVNQGLCWSMTVVMKVDLVGPRRRGLALGLNEFAGYIAVGAVAYLATIVASATSLRTGPFVLGELIAFAGLALALLSQETRAYVPMVAPTQRPTMQRVFVRATLTDRALSSATQAGLVNNLNDGLAWGLLPLYFLTAGIGLDQVGLLVAAYPLVWGIAQVGTGAVSDVIGRRWLVIAGMTTQAIALAGLVAFRGFTPWLAAMILLGLGTALVYPTLLAVVADVADPSWRASAIGVYRLWRDSGYVVGAIAAGLLADALGAAWAIEVVAALTFLSGMIALARMPETHPLRGGAH